MSSRKLRDNITKLKTSSTNFLTCDIEKVVEIFQKNDLGEIEYQKGDERIKLTRKLSHTSAGAPIHNTLLSAPQAQHPIPEGERQGENVSIITNQADDKNLPPSAAAKNILKSPMVGTAYLAPSPDAKPFVAKGDRVKPGDTLLIIEAMKTMNPIKAKTDSTVKDICVKNGQAVEFGEPLVVLDDV